MPTPSPSATITASITPTPSVTPSTLIAGPIAYYKFDEGTGTSLADTTGNGNDGTAVNSPSWGVGKYGSALNFNGNDTLVSIVDNAGDLDNIEKQGGMTVVAWINPVNSGFGGAGRIVDKDNNEGGWFLSMKGTNQIQFVGDEFATSAMTVISTATVQLNSWNHIAVTWDGKADGNNCLIYINGVLSATTKTIGVGASGTDSGIPIVIGNRTAADRGFNGGIEEVAMWDRVLSVTEVSRFMTPNPTPTPSPSISNSPTPSKSLTPSPSSSASSVLNGPVAFFNFDEGSGTTAADSTIYGNTATLVNGPLWVTGKAGTAIDFQKNTSVLTANGGGSLANLHLTGMSVACWIFPRTSGAGGAGRIIDKDNSQGGWFFAMKNTSQLQFVGDEFATDPLVVVSTNTLTLNAWNHVAVTWDGNANGNNCLIYINGALSAVTITAGSGNPDSDLAVPLCIGNRTQDNARGFDGYIDEMYIYSRVITQAKIQELMGAVLVPTPTPVVSNTVTASVSVTPSISASHAVSPTIPLTPTNSPSSSQSMTPSISKTPPVTPTPPVTKTPPVTPTKRTTMQKKFNPGPGYWQMDYNIDMATQYARMTTIVSLCPDTQGIEFLWPWAKMENPLGPGVSGAARYDGSWTLSLDQTNPNNWSGFVLWQKFLDKARSLGIQIAVVVRSVGGHSDGGDQAYNKFPSSMFPTYLGNSTYGPNTAQTNGRWGGIWINSYGGTNNPKAGDPPDPRGPGNGSNFSMYFRWWDPLMLPPCRALAAAYGAKFDQDQNLEWVSWGGDEIITAVTTGITEDGHFNQVYGTNGIVAGWCAAFPTTTVRSFESYRLLTNLDKINALSLDWEFGIGGPDTANDKHYSSSNPVLNSPAFARSIDSSYRWKGYNKAPFNGGVRDTTVPIYVDQGMYFCEVEGEDLSYDLGYPNKDANGNIVSYGKAFSGDGREIGDGCFQHIVTEVNELGAQYIVWYMNWNDFGRPAYPPLSARQCVTGAHPHLADYVQALLVGGNTTYQTLNPGISHRNKTYPKGWKT
jgi:hypothetical protein